MRVVSGVSACPCVFLFSLRGVVMDREMCGIGVHGVKFTKIYEKLFLNFMLLNSVYYWESQL